MVLYLLASYGLFTEESNKKFFSTFWINKEYSKLQKVITYYKPTMLKEYDGVFTQYPDLKEGKFEEFKKLCEDWLN